MSYHNATPPRTSKVLKISKAADHVKDKHKFSTLKKDVQTYPIKLSNKMGALPCRNTPLCNVAQYGGSYELVRTKR
jgi:hypothetical protein